jgi:hypothetical protein
MDYEYDNIINGYNDDDDYDYYYYHFHPLDDPGNL